MSEQEPLVHSLAEGRKKMTLLLEEHNDWVEKNLTPVKIKNDEDLSLLVDKLHYSKKVIQVIEEERKKIVAPFNEVVSKTNSFFKAKFIEPITHIKNWTEAEVNRYTAEQERIKQEAIKKQQEEIERLAQLSVQKQIEKGIDENEAKANVEVIKKEATSVIMAQAESYATSKTKQATMGKLVQSTTWSFDEEKSDLLLLCNYIIKHPDQVSLIQFNIPAINRYKPTKKVKPPEIPGIVFTSKTINTAR